MLCACVLSYTRIKVSLETESNFATRFNYFVNAVVGVIVLVMILFALGGYSRPEQTVDLKAPLRDGQFVVLHGGSRPFINAHAKITPQNHALDIVGINSVGMRAGSIKGGQRLEDYVIFGSPVYAPCAGTILIAVDGLPDLVPPNTDRQNIAGNHVLLACRDFEVLLAHFKQNSVLVSVGQRVSEHNIIAQVGNTGNTSEPHLHIHAERGGQEKTILNGEGVAITIDGRFLVRGDRF